MTHHIALNLVKATISSFARRIAHPVVARLQARRAELRDYFRSRQELGAKGKREFRAARRTQEYRAVYDKSLPLVSVCIPTYNRANLLVHRSLKSACNQTYENLQIIVVGDGCTDHTAELIKEVVDERVMFVNLAERGKYPEDPLLRWMVAGAAAINHALALAEGEFVTQLDDDDEMLPDRIEKLVAFSRQMRVDFIWHPFWCENNDGSWRLNEARRFTHGRVTTSSVFYHRWFKSIPLDMEAYRYREPGDWNRFRKIRYLGAKHRRYPEPLLRHYKERTQLAQ